MLEDDIFPRFFGRYVLLQAIGRGSRTETFRAVDYYTQGSRRLVALKRLLPLLAGDRNIAEAYGTECRLLADLDHANVVRSLGQGSIDGRPFRAMEYIQGRSLHEIVQASNRAGLQVPLEVFCYVLHETLYGLEHIHRRMEREKLDPGVQPRGLTPAYILLAFDGSVRVVQIGLAEAGQTAVHSVGGLIKGKSTYMSPEQARNERLDARADIFSLGACFYEVLTGEPMYAADNVDRLLRSIYEAWITLPRELDADIPVELQQVLMRALERDPERRYADAFEWRAALQEYISRNDVRFLQDDVQAFLSRLFPGARVQEMRVIARELAEVGELEAQGKMPTPDAIARGPALGDHPTFNVMPRFTSASVDADHEERVRAGFSTKMADPSDLPDDAEVGEEDLPDEDDPPTMEIRSQAYDLETTVEVKDERKRRKKRRKSKKRKD